jgi:hypothetical protein
MKNAYVARSKLSRAKSAVPSSHRGSVRSVISNVQKNFNVFYPEEYFRRTG